MTRRAVTLLLALPEKLRFVRGLRAWLGLPARPFPISRAAPPPANLSIPFGS